VVWFGESIPPAALLAADRAAAACDVFLSVGTAAVVYPAAGLAERAAGAGATLVEVNLEPTALSPLAHTILQGPAGVVLPRLLQAVQAG
jgi:NAD-dependent deacetylase